MSSPPRLPRGSLAFVALVHAVVTGVAARVLPWPSFSVFALIAGLTSASHLAVAALAAVGSPKLGRAWRISALLSLAFLGYVTYAAASSGFYVARLYAGVGVPLAAAACAAWCVVALFTLPIACWGLAKTRRAKPDRAARASKLPVDAGPLALVLTIVSAAYGVGARAASSRAEPTLSVDEGTPDAVAATLANALRSLPTGRALDVPLFAGAPSNCPERPGPGRATILATFIQENHTPTSICVQAASLEDAAAQVAGRLDRSWTGGPIALDVVTGRQPLPDAGALLGAVLLRPGKDGACRGRACLSPWQLFGDDQFTRLAGFPALQLKVGISAPALVQALGGPVAPPVSDPLSATHAGFAGIDRLETSTFIRRVDGSIERMTRLLGPPLPVTRPTVLAAARGALAYAAGAQEDDGKFRYLVDPFTGETSYAGFAVARQAGTTLALCDASGLDLRSKLVATRSLNMLSSLEQRFGDRGGIVFPAGSGGNAQLGSSALTMIALLACRDRVGHQFDPLIGRLGNALLAIQRPDGGFFPAFDPKTGSSVHGQDMLYADGQGVYALVLWEAAKGMDKPDGIGPAIDRAMDYFAGSYWQTPMHDFFFLEENWHVLAARAALTSGHRRDAYERFCVEYMTMKKRLVMDEASDVDDEFVGAYGFGDVLPPHHAATSGFAEALAAVMAVKRARGESVEDDERVLRKSLAYLLKNQWREDNCFFCTHKVHIPGGFSENIGSPVIRIDFIQHALAAISHGGRELELLGPEEVSGPR